MGIIKIICIGGRGIPMGKQLRSERQQNMQEKNTDKKLPERVLKDISAIAEMCSVEKIVLFGSRARGENTERSDIDIAVYGGNFEDFYWKIKENVHSLLMFDVVDIDAGISEELVQEIERDGVVIYEKTR